jgi:hypothetical protein
MGGVSERTRRVASIALAVAGSVLALVGGIALYLREEVFDAGGFAGNAAETLKDGDVREELEEPIVDQAIDRGPDVLINVRPVLVAAVDGVLGSTPFRTVFRKGARKLHQAVFSKDREEIAFTVGNADVLVADAVDKLSPGVGRQIPRDLGDRLVQVTDSKPVLTAARVSHDVRVLGVVLPLAALLCLGGSIAVAPDRRRALLVVSSSIAAAAAVGFIAYLGARAILLAQFDDVTLRHAVEAVWDAFLGGLRNWLLGVGFLAVVVGAAAATARERDPMAPARRVAELVTREPESSRGRAGRAVAVGALGLLFVAEPLLALEIVAVLVGAYAVFFAACALLGLIAPATEERRGWGDRRPPPRALAGAAVVASIVVVGIVVLLIGRDRGERQVERPSGPVERCNGFAELCDQTLDRVSFPATHNAMSAAELPGWYQPNQRYDIRRQLDDGVRAFLIDSHYGVKRKSGPVLTDLELEQNSKVLEEVTAQLGPDAATAFTSLQAEFARRGGEGDAGAYFCHVVCELGSTSMTQVLGWFKDFLDTHPDELLVLFIEDKVSPSDTAKAFEKSGILHYAYIHKPGKPFPTMRELIEKDKRLFVMAEVDFGRGAIPWYHEGFRLAMETPYTFTAAEELQPPESCVPNRGGTGKALFQINHWVEKLPRSPKLAEQVNDRAFLLKRARACERERGALPGIVAVDHYDKGHVLEVTAAINGIPEGTEPEYRESG